MLHFLLISLALFALYTVASTGGDRSPETISVDREALINFMQYRHRSFERDRFERLLDEMEPGELDRVTSQFVAEEAMFREAKAMRLDESDYVTRMRLVQQLEYLTKAAISNSYELAQEDLERFYEVHKDEYFIEPTVTFAHVFLSRTNRSAEALEKTAAELGAHLEENKVGFSEASRQGDRFLYHVNYVEKGFGHLASHFGQQMASSLMALKADANGWQGPFESVHGVHYVLMPRQTAGYQPALTEVIAKVRDDAYQAEMARRHQDAVDAIVERYVVVRKPLAGAQSSYTQ